MLTYSEIDKIKTLYKNGGNIIMTSKIFQTLKILSKQALGLPRLLLIRVVQQKENTNHGAQMN